MKSRAVLLGLLLLVLSVAVSATQAQTAAEVKARYTKTEQLITMRDGVKLFTSLYVPKDTTRKYAIMLSRTPYTVAPYGPDAYKTVLGPSMLFQNEGFIFVYQDVRGRWMSEGEFEDVRPYIPNKTGKQIDETSDTYDTVDWLIKNIPNNNGRVGVWGISYPGFYTSMAGIDNHPAVKAISPQAPVSDWFNGDDMHHNGALFLAQNYSFFAFFGQPRPTPTSKFDYIKEFNLGTEDGYNFFLTLGGLANAGDLSVQGHMLHMWCCRCRNKLCASSASYPRVISTCALVCALDTGRLPNGSRSADNLSQVFWIETRIFRYAG